MWQVWHDKPKAWQIKGIAYVTKQVQAANRADTAMSALHPVKCLHGPGKPSLYNCVSWYEIFMPQYSTWQLCHSGYSLLLGFTVVQNQHYMSILLVSKCAEYESAGYHENNRDVCLRHTSLILLSQIKSMFPEYKPMPCHAIS